MSTETHPPQSVLVIDDSDVELEVLEIFLKREGYSVETANNGEAGVAALRARIPDVVLLDLHMPGLDGFGVLQTLKADPATADVPVLVVSGSTVENDVVRALEMGAQDYVQKPYTIDILLARVRAALRSRREKQAIWQLGEDLRGAQEELARARRGAAIGAIAAGLAHEINNPAAFVVTDLHEVRELAQELAEAGDETRAESLIALADEALLGMHRIRDVVRDLAVFVAVADDTAPPASGFVDLAAVVKRRAERFGGRALVRGANAPALVPAGLGGADELDALVGLLIRHVSLGGEANVLLTLDREDRLICLHVEPENTRDATSDALSLIIARELAERFGGTLSNGQKAGSWVLKLTAATSG